MVAELAQIGGVSIAWAFAAGLLSFVSPCVLPLVPGYVSWVAGHSVEELSRPGLSRARIASLRLGLGFVAGFSIVFVSLGASASAIGQLLFRFRAEAELVAGVIVVLFGLHMLGLLRVPALHRDWRLAGPARPGSAWGASLFGAAFAFGWTPCIGPILGSILMLGAAQGSVAQGTALLALYSLGLAIPFLLVAAFTGDFLRRSRALARAGARLQQVAGGVLVLVGVAMATGWLKFAGTWLLQAFPAFQRLVI